MSYDLTSIVESLQRTITQGNTSQFTFIMERHFVNLGEQILLYKNGYSAFPENRINLFHHLCNTSSKEVNSILFYSILKYAVQKKIVKTMLSSHEPYASIYSRGYKRGDESTWLIAAVGNNIQIKQLSFILNLCEEHEVDLKKLLLYTDGSKYSFLNWAETRGLNFDSLHLLLEYCNRYLDESEVKSLLDSSILVPGVKNPKITRQVHRVPAITLLMNYCRLHEHFSFVRKWSFIKEEEFQIACLMYIAKNMINLLHGNKKVSTTNIQIVHILSNFESDVRFQRLLANTKVSVGKENTMNKDDENQTNNEIPFMTAISQIPEGDSDEIKSFFLTNDKKSCFKRCAKMYRDFYLKWNWNVLEVAPKVDDSCCSVQ